MKLFAGKALLLPLVLAGTFAVGLPQAEAQSLFEHLFGGGIRNQRMEDGGYRQRSGRDDGRYYGNRQGYRPGRPQRPVARKPAAVAKINAPSYYNYKAAALQRVDFAPLAAIGQSASLDQATSGTAFREAVAGLAGYELFAEPEIAKALVEYYSANPDFIWVTDNERQRARAAMRCGCWAKPASHGLSPADYAISVPSASLSRRRRRRAQERADPLRDGAVGARAALCRTTPRAAASIRTASPATTISRKSRSTWSGR